MAAIPLPVKVSSLKGHFTNAFPFKKPLLCQNNNNTLELGTRRRTLPVVVVTRALSQTNESMMASIITDLEKEEQQEKVSKEESDARKLAECWRKIHGEDNWNDMLDPMDPFLRSELIRYGEMAQACYDSFDFDPYSKYCGSCRFNRRRFFESLGMKSLGYEVSRYIYATANINLPNFSRTQRVDPDDPIWSRNANWIGYVAVSNDETSVRLGRRDITIAWRGTVTKLEWIADLMDYLKPLSADKIPCPDPTVKVESGFLELYTDKDENCRFCKYSAREQILTEVRRLIQRYPKEELSITITGHSLGAALAVLSGFDIGENVSHLTADGQSVPISVFSFAGPRVGNVRFKERLEGLGVKVLRVVNVHDTVAKVPGLVLNEHVPEFLQKMAEGLPWSYSHVGVELALDHKKSPFLKDTNNPPNFHNLEAHLHLLDGFHGKSKEFKASNKRDIALVNKSSNFLKDTHAVPPNWRQDENKGMVMNEEGRWVQPERPKLEDHPVDIHHHMKQLGLASD
ncbi:phospholipase A1-Igamma2, chloroplastic-like [Telopea speciosissima]|uniref:phospholipase A1-Igamma2, chloroplastic-like n=1 Tax=Telopea speciosissima TaxID=54955 RepID=UPI001CC7E976|nr:phospholipase A1-Igamma2, chloroplastic-like [Telopea speciosissima]